MRKLFGLLTAGFFVIGMAGQAHAAALGFVGSLKLQIASFEISLPGSGTATVNASGPGGHLTGLDLAGGTFATNAFVLPVTDPAAVPVKGLQFTAANGAGAFAGSGGAGFGGPMPVKGFSKICLFFTCSFPPSANVTVPLDVIGAGGTVVVAGAVAVTVVGAPWTTGTAAIGTVTRMGGVSPLSNTGANSGTVTLVTPVFISTNIPASAVVPGFGILSLHFVPEPGTLALVGFGIAGLVGFGRSRARK